MGAMKNMLYGEVLEIRDRTGMDEFVANKAYFELYWSNLDSLVDVDEMGLAKDKWQLVEVVAKRVYGRYMKALAKDTGYDEKDLWRDYMNSCKQMYQNKDAVLREVFFDVMDQGYSLDFDFERKKSAIKTALSCLVSKYKMEKTQRALERYAFS
jgi:hypothetical protein